MKKAFCALVACLLLLTVVPLSVYAQGGKDEEGRDPAFEREIYDRLAEINPQAVPLFQEATQALDTDDLKAARRGYEQVLALAPEFPDANRRLSHVYRALDDGESALTHAERAFSTDPSPYNEQALTLALLVLADDQAAAEQALAHARSSAEALPDEIDAQLTLFFAAGLAEDVETMHQAVAALQRLDPNHLATHYAATLLAAQEGRWEDAERELALAEAAGLPAEDVRALRQIIDGTGGWSRWAIAGVLALVGWLVAALLLLGTGSLLSRLTLAAVRRTQSTGQFEVSSGERAIRALYRGVIALSALYFYVSLPVVALIVLVGAGGIFYGLYTGPGIPTRLAIALVVFVIFSLYALVRGIFVRIREQEPGRALSREEAPRLWSLAEQVAQRVGTEPIERITVTPPPTIAVTERGRRWFKPRAAGTRTLILGLGALNGLTQGQLAAILAHEYGHFSNRDTAGGDLANRIGASIRQIAYSLAASGQARWYNPVWLFLRGFDHLFSRITRGASRLQEVLADRYAALAYGSRDFIAGLQQIVRQSLTFQIQAGHEIETALEQGRAVPNLFVLAPPQNQQVREHVEAEIDKEMNRETEPFDAHPAPKERIALLERLASDIRGASDTHGAVDIQGGAEPAWALIDDPVFLQAEMMAVVTGDLGGQPVRAPDQAEERPQAGVPDESEERLQFGGPDEAKESQPVRAPDQAEERLQAGTREETQERLTFDAPDETEERLTLGASDETKEWLTFGEPDETKESLPAGTREETQERLTWGASDETVERPQAGAPDETNTRQPAGVLDETNTRQPAGVPDETEARSQAEERPPRHHRERVRFYVGLYTILAAALLGAIYLWSRQLSWLLAAIGLTLVSIWTSFVPIVRGWFTPQT